MKISKGVWAIILIVAVLLVVVLLIVNANKKVVPQNTQNNTNTNTNNTGAVTTKDVTQATQGKVAVANVNIVSQGDSTNVSAQVTNNDTKTYSIVDISVIFYDANNNTLATAKGLIEKLEPGVTKSFSSSITGDFSKSSKYEVKIEKAQ